MRVSRCLLLIALALPALSVQAFGPAGHRAVARIAEAGLHAETRAAIQTLLALEGASRLDEVATWADELRDVPGFEKSSRWHYVNLVRGECRYRPDIHCPDGDCVIGAIETQRRLLADPKAAPQARAQALKWLVHLVADVHQPLHTGYADDRGGNLYQVQLAGKGTNLHAAWDSGLNALRGETWPKLAARVSMLPVNADIGFAPDAAQRWAEEGCALLESEVYPGRRKLSRTYIERAQRLFDQRVRLAAARLATLLNETLTP